VFQELRHCAILKLRICAGQIGGQYSTARATAIVDAVAAGAGDPTVGHRARAVKQLTTVSISAMVAWSAPWRRALADRAR